MRERRREEIGLYTCVCVLGREREKERLTCEVKKHSSLSMFS